MTIPLAPAKSKLIDPISGFVPVVSFHFEAIESEFIFCCSLAQATYFFAYFQPIMVVVLFAVAAAVFRRVNSTNRRAFSVVQPIGFVSVVSVVQPIGFVQCC